MSNAYIAMSLAIAEAIVQKRAFTAVAYSTGEKIERR